MVENLIQLQKMGQDMSILYVEDNGDLREAFSLFLKKFFKSVTLCVDGRDGLETYKKSHYDIVITDINMPYMNGLEMSHEIKKINAQQHIIIVSAYKDVDNYVEAVRIGVDGYVLKPVEFQQVNAILTKICLQIKSIRENIAYKNHLEELVELKRQEIKEHYITDPLTGLHNRIYFNEQHYLSSEGTIILLNIDNFSIVNYNFGFSVGDSIIKKSAQMLQSFENDIFTLFRIQGDEFLFFAKGLHIEEAQNLAQSIKAYFASCSVKIDQIELNLSFTIAIDFGKERDILRSASLTIQKIRQIGKNHIGLYEKDSDFEKLQKNNLVWIERIKECFSNKSFTVFFQPIMNIKTGKIDKYEVLSRIITPDKEIIVPYLFLQPLVLAGLLTDFTRGVIDMAFAFAKEHKIVITINITSEDFKEQYLIAYLEEKREEYGLERSDVILEILESISTIDADVVLDQLRELKEMGYKIAIDDFGTENSNFSRLLTLKVDFIKIDGSFIKNIVTDSNAQEIVKAIVAFAHNIGCSIIAEFVHSKEVYDKVAEYGIDFAQGYYISEPKQSLYKEKR